MAFDESLYVTAKFTTAKGLLLSKQSNALTIKDTSNIESTLELREGTFTSLSGGTLKLANGHSVVFTPGGLTTHNVTAAQAGVASLVGTTPTYHVKGPALVKVLKYPNNATAIGHENSPNLIEVPSILPPNVTVLANMFWGCTNFNHPNISNWNVSKVRDMRFMFRGCTNFNQPLNNWNVSSVTDMDSMFWEATTFNQPLDKWDVSKVTDMRNMFYGCTKFNQSLNSWNVSNVVTTYAMFYGCSSFNQLLMFWDVSNVTNMGYMFSGCSSFDQFLASWNTSKVTNMGYMFYDCSSFNQNISGWDTSKVIDMGGMFSGCTSFNLPLNSWNTTNVASMGAMFDSCTSFNQPLDNWNVSKVTDMSGMFSGCTSFNQDLRQWCVSLITSKPNAFNYNAPLFTTSKHPVWGTCPTPLPSNGEIISNEDVSFYYENRIFGNGNDRWVAGFEFIDSRIVFNGVSYPNDYTFWVFTNTLMIPTNSPVHSVFERYNKVEAKFLVSTGQTFTIYYDFYRVYDGRRQYSTNWSEWQSKIAPHKGKTGKMSVRLYN